MGGLASIILTATVAAGVAIVGILAWQRITGSGPRLPIRRVGNNRLNNPSFEEGVKRDNKEFVMTLAPGATIPGWEVVRGEVGWSHENGTGRIQASHQTRFMDLTNGGAKPGVYGGVRQGLLLTPGALYELSFDLGASAALSAELTSVTVTVEKPGLPSVSTTFGLAKPQNNWVWSLCRVLFEAEGIAAAGGVGIRFEIHAPSQAISKMIGVDNVQLFELSSVLASTR